MSIKDLFGKSSGKIVNSKQLETLYNEAESKEFLEEVVKDNARLLTNIDFSTASNFAKYGSAEKYYSDAIRNIYERFPYDGSRKEKLAWRNNSSQFDIYVFDNIHPKTTGYISLGSASWAGSASTSSFTAGGVVYKLSSAPQYVYAFGGPNTSSTGKFVDANIYDLTKNRGSNLAFNQSNYGNTAEFWFKETSDNSSGFALFDIWNNTNLSSSDYTRFLVERIETNKFHVTYRSGSFGVTRAEISCSNIDRYQWHHYAFSVANTGSQLEINLFIDGQLTKTINTGSSVSSSANAGSKIYVGAYTTSPIINFSTGSWNGRGSVYGSFDEFRFWKEKRTSQNIGRYWFTNVAGGANTDDSNTELGIYFKFNEGIISSVSSSALDARCLDYSGRISNGIITNYHYTVRSTGSAIEDYSSEFYEEKDPILFLENPILSDTLLQYTISGSLYDEENNSNIYKSLPTWITEEQEETSGNDLSNLVQIISSYFDTLHIQIQELPRIKDQKYFKDGEKPVPFINKILSSYDFDNLELFSNTNFFEEVLSRNESLEFEDSLTNIKNNIYQNIYNNLSLIYKSKGTEKSLRNLIRCFGIDDELLKINIYSDNSEFNFTNKYQYVSYPKKFVDFNDADRFEGFIYQKAITGNSDTRGYISGSENSGALKYVPITLQAEVIFPKKVSYDSPNYVIPEFTTVSLFGAHTAKEDESDLSWGTDEFKLVVTAEKRGFESKDAYFKLSGSLSSSGFILTSSWFDDIYDNEKWNIAVRIKPQKYDNADFVSGSSTGDYVVEFYGVNSTLDVVENSFSLSTTIGSSSAQSALSKNKRVYAGAHYLNFDPTQNLTKSDVKISSVRFWFDYLTDKEIKEHSYDASNLGRNYPNWNAYLSNTNSSVIGLTKIDTLALNWDFNQVTGTDGSGEFFVEDVSSGSVELSQRYGYGELGKIIKFRHTGYGKNFFANDNQVVNKEYIFSAKQQNPEVIAGSDMVQIRDVDDIVSTRNTRPTTYFYSIEKSLSNVINDEILTWFATIDAFNNLIGEPTEKYRKTYKGLDHLRALFFDKVKNEPEYEKFLEFFKWIDSSISMMLSNLIPASANVSSRVVTLIESHMLERNKYLHKLPTIETKGEFIATTTNVTRFNYQEQKSALNETGSLWLKQRVERTSPLVASGDSATDSNREEIRKVLISKNLNKLPKQYDIVTGQYYEGKRDLNRGFGNITEITTSVLNNPESRINVINIENRLLDTNFQFASASVTASGQIVQEVKKQGNFLKNYEIVQTSGRRDNNKALPEILDLLNITSSDSFVQDRKDYLLPTRATVKSVFVEKFSAPGGAENSSRGALDKTSEEYSAYNDLNTRNLLVRKNYNKWLAESSSIDASSPSIHKVNKNPGYIDSTASYDNGFISHQIPRSDSQYAWVTASIISKPTYSGYAGQYTNLEYPLTFLSASDFEGYTIDYLGINLIEPLNEATYISNLRVNVNTASNLVSPVKVTKADEEQPETYSDISGDFLNLYLLKLNGPYQNSGWKQIRNELNRLVRISRKDNFVLLQDPPKLEIQTNGLTRFIRNRSQTFTRYKEPPVSYNKPIEHTVGIDGSDQDIEIASTYENNKEKLSNINLINVLNVSNRTEPQAHDILLELSGGSYKPSPSIKKIKYAQEMYPRKNDIGTKNSRVRYNLEQLTDELPVTDLRTFWKTDVIDRQRGYYFKDLFNYKTSSAGTVPKVLFPYNNIFFSGSAYFIDSDEFNNYGLGYRNSIFANDLRSSIRFEYESNSTPVNFTTVPILNFIHITPQSKVKDYGIVDSINTNQKITKILDSGFIDGGTIFVSVSASFGTGGVGGTTSSFASYRQTTGAWTPVGSPQITGAVNGFLSTSQGIYVYGSLPLLSVVPTGSVLSLWNGTVWTSYAVFANPYVDGGGNTSDFRGVYDLISASDGIYFCGAFQTASNTHVTSSDNVAFAKIPSSGPIVSIITGTLAELVNQPAIVVSGAYRHKTLLSTSQGIYIGGDSPYYGQAGVLQRWDGSTVTNISGFQIYNDNKINFMTSASNGIYVAGDFIIDPVSGGAGSPYSTNNLWHIARWNGSSWFGVGRNPTPGYGTGDILYSNSGFNCGFSSSNGIFLGGSWTQINETGSLSRIYTSGEDDRFILRWDGNTWNTVIDELGDARTYNVGQTQGVTSLFSGSRGLYIGGQFTEFSPLFNVFLSRKVKGSIAPNDLLDETKALKENNTNYLACIGYYDEQKQNITNIFNDLGTQTDDRPYFVHGGAFAQDKADTITAILSASDGIYIGGNFQHDAEGQYFAKFDGESFQEVGTASLESNFGISGFNTPVGAIISSSNGIFVGGRNEGFGGDTNLKHLARWDGNNWKGGYNIGSTFDNIGGGSFFTSLNAILDCTNQPGFASGTIIIGGAFQNYSANMRGIAKWDGTSWTQMVSGTLDLNSTQAVKCMAYDNGILYAGLYSWNNTAIPYYSVYFDGTGSWNPIGTDGGVNGPVYALVSSSEGVYVGGKFTNLLSGTNSNINKIGLWNGTSWVALGQGLNGDVYSIASNSSGIYVGGDFTNNRAGTSLNKIAKWNGTSWEQVGRTGPRNGLTDTVGEVVNAIYADDENIVFGGYFYGTKSNILLKDKKYPNLFEGFRATTNNTIDPQPQLVFNNFIPPVVTINNQLSTVKVFESSIEKSLAVDKFIYILNAGYEYETERISGKQPFYNTYEEFAEHSKAYSKNYGLIPEYSISDFMERYTKEANGDFTKILTQDYLKLDGAASSSGFFDINNAPNTTNTINTNFYSPRNNLKNNKLTIKLSAIKKLLPYRGFYPSERVVKLASYFINSFIKPNEELVSIDNSNLIFSSSLSNGTPIDKQILTLLQPLFAPGILMNTVKSSIAVDFPVFITNSVQYDSETPPDFYGHTGSTLVSSKTYIPRLDAYTDYTASNYIDKRPNFRLPFEALIDFDTLIPESLKISDNNLYYLNPTYYTQDANSSTQFGELSYPSYNMGSGSLKKFEFFDPNYKLAMHNFLAEIPNFFLQQGKLTSIISREESKFSNVVSGTRYYMDVKLEKDSGFQQFIGSTRYEGLKSAPAAPTDFFLPSPDSLFGPPVRYWQTASSAQFIFNNYGPYVLFSRLLDTPAYAPYLPPYYYGAEIARISYLATASGKTSLEDIFQNSQVEFINENLESLFGRASGRVGSSGIGVTNYLQSPAYLERMKLTSSVNLFLKTEIKDVSTNTIGTNTTVSDPVNKQFAWAIQTKFETPAINFINVDQTSNIGLTSFKGERSTRLKYYFNNTPIYQDHIYGVYKNLYKGIWTTYGTPSSDNAGIKISIASPYTRQFRTGSLIDVCGFTTTKKSIGILAENKKVSEAVVLIPYTQRKNEIGSLNPAFATTIPEIPGENYSRFANIQSGVGPYYYSINRETIRKLLNIDFSSNSSVTVEEIEKAINAPNVDKNNSIVQLMQNMIKFVVPPHLDWIRNKTINPFVMYIVPFDMILDKNDLSDIWQGVMPKPSLKQEIDEKEITHNFTPDEFFHAKKPMNDTKFKIFKIKQRANINYYKLTEDSKDDVRFKFKFNNSQEAAIPQFSYNYPYDFFSIVELINVKSEIESSQDNT